jgi:hypothetical protein
MNLNEQDIIEAMIEKYGISHMLTVIAYICDDKALKIQDGKKHLKWERTAKAIQRAANC